MQVKEQLGKLSVQIDEIDEKIISLFQERMSIAQKEAQIKGENNMSILDAAREQQIVDKAVSLADDNLRGEVTLLMRSMMALAGEHQRGQMFRGRSPLLPPPVQPAAGSVVVAYQGVAGAWSEQAAIKLFPGADNQAVEFFEDVFLAVKEKRANYGVVPIENSQTGAIGETYDLLRKYGCYIVGRTWVEARQCLLAPQGARLADVREVLSHPEGFKQCRGFLRGRAWDLTACRNTAVAAGTAAGSGRKNIAAIGSRRAAELNGLQVLVPDIMDSAENRTSFVVIAAEPEYDEKSALISITFSTKHRSGALCETLLPFMAQGVNLTRIESRPASPGNYRFFAEIQGNILDADIINTLRKASATCEYFEVIGCYTNT